MILGPHPLACILPPDMLERLILNGSQEQRQDALRTLARDNSLRSLRAQNLALRIGSFPPLPAHVGVDGVPNRTVFDCTSTEDLRSARRVRAEGEEATGDVAVDEAYDGLGATSGSIWDVYERNSIDGEGMPLQRLPSTTAASYDNAFWDGQRDGLRRRRRPGVRPLHDRRSTSSATS